VPERKFLGWERPALETAAEWLVETHGAEMGKLVVALPGRRAGRRLLELLVERVRAVGPAGAFEPPAIVTVGRLLDEMVLTGKPFAGRLARTLTWARALSQQPAAAMKRLMAQPPGADDLPAWLALSEDVRSLHGQLAAEGLGFEQVRAEVRSHAGGAEVSRWETLVGVQQTYRKQLDALGLVDPHEARQDALQADRLDRNRNVVVIGAAELSRLQRELLDRLGTRATLLVLAPDELSDTFDDHGCVRTEAWSERELPLERASWWVVDEPRDQASKAAEVLTDWGTRLSGEQISIGVPDPSVTPFLERRLSEDAVDVRIAAGTDYSALGPWRLLDAVATYLDGRRYAALAALVRHPDLSSLLPEESIERVDAYAEQHLPDRVPDAAKEPWLGREEHAAPLRELCAVLDKVFGDLGLDEARPLPRWADPILALLVEVYGKRKLQPEQSEDDRLLHGALSSLRKALDEITALDEARGQGLEFTAALALHVVLRSVASDAAPPPQVARLAKSQPIELLGWAELALDDAPALMITGFNEGHVPEPSRSGAWLPDRLRRELSLPDSDQRQARDAYALALILQGGREVALISGRRGTEGDPLRPSRLAFHCPDEAVAERVRQVLAVEPTAGSATTPDTVRALPGPSPILPWTPPTTLRVTAFRLYLQSPLLFYLEVVRKLDGVEDELHELGPLHFGNLAHEVLQDFGNSTLKHSADEQAVRALLDKDLGRRVTATYGRRPLPAVVLQVEQLRRRLSAFARWQVEQVAEGWRIAHAEWAPEGGQVPLIVDGEPIGLRGRIDRVDLNTDGKRWRVLDYKTSENPSKPRQAHGPGQRDGLWRDLQLPLYELLSASLSKEYSERGFDPRPGLGYVNLPRDVQQTRERMADWSDEELDTARDAADGVVRAVRDGRFEKPGRLLGDDPILAALAGEGLLSGSLDAEDVDDPTQDGEA
jgi:hypothetical protein